MARAALITIGIATSVAGSLLLTQVAQSKGQLHELLNGANGDVLLVAQAKGKKDSKQESKKDSKDTSKSTVSTKDAKPPKEAAKEAKDSKADDKDSKDKESKDKDAKDADAKKPDAKNGDKKADAKDAKAEPEKEIVVPNVVALTTDKLVADPKGYLGKNIKFTAAFSAFTNLALNYKPAFRSQKENISFLVFRPESKIPYSELKLAMPIPKEKDPKSKMLVSLKEGDTIEVTGHVFSTALDEPWVDVLKLKKLASAKGKEGETEEETEE